MNVKQFLFGCSPVHRMPFPLPHPQVQLCSPVCLQTGAVNSLPQLQKQACANEALGHTAIVPGVGKSPYYLLCILYTSLQGLAFLKCLLRVAVLSIMAYLFN